MAYICDLGDGHTITLDYRGTQTMLTLATQRVGQQQQASSAFTTSPWTAPPQVSYWANGALIKLITTQGDHYLQVHGQSMRVVQAAQVPAVTQPLPMQEIASPPEPGFAPMQPMQPMQPMTMGNMQMSLNPMEMRMGNMEMRMGNATLSPPATPPSGTTPASTAPAQRRFCGQCGAAVQSSDRFCSSCGQPLS
jgi:hypothetical protein